MKKLILILSLFTCFWQIVEAQKTLTKPTNEQATVQASDTAITELPTTPPQAVTTRDSSAIPDSICVDTKSGLICVPTGDTQILIDIVTQIAAENKGNWPTTILGWVTLVLGIAFSARGGVAITAAKKVYAVLKVFLRSTLNIVAFIAGAIAAGATFLLGKGQFDLQTFSTIWGITAFLLVYIYETWIKKPETTPAAKA